MSEAKNLIIFSLLISLFGLTSQSSSEENDREFFNLVDKRGLLNESLLPSLEDVKELKISNCTFEDVSVDTFKFMPKLKKVVIRDSEFDTIPEGVFQSCPKLKEINIKRTKIHKLDDGTFANLTKLEEVEIESSNIELEEGMFSGCSVMVELEWNQCELKTFNPEALNDLNLKELELKDNKIEEFSFRNFPKMSNLKVINLSGNPLSSFDITGIQEKCPNLRKIKLKKTNVPPDTLEKLASLNIRVKTGD